MTKGKKKQGTKTQERRYRQGKHHAAEQIDFSRRKMRPTTVQLIIFAMIPFCVIVYSVINMERLGGPSTLVTISACVFLLTAAMAIMVLDHLHNAIFSNEFETALFAGAAGTGADFFAIVRRNRQVVYTSPSLRSTFGGTVHDYAGNLGELLDAMGIEAEQRDRLLLALISKGRLDVFASVKPAGAPRRMMELRLDPIKRPGGYFVLRGVKMASADKFAQDVPSGDITHSFEQLLEEMPCGVYKVSARGVMLYVNPAFEEMLGYGTGEMLMEHAKFTDIVHEGFRDTPFHQRWEGAVAFRHRNGTPVRLRLKQAITPGDSGKELLRLGFVTHATADAPHARGKRGRV